MTSEQERRRSATAARDQKHGVRLVNGNSDNEGRLEVFHDGEWGSVCDGNFTNVEAQVVCRQLGYTSGMALQNAPFGRGVGTIWMDDVACNGAETRIQDCWHRGWGVKDCSHSEDVGIRCSGYTERQIGFLAYPSCYLCDFNFPDEGAIIVFDNTKYNYGSGYSTSSGKFQAPISGMYQVNVHLTCRTGDVEYYLKVDGERVTFNDEYNKNIDNRNKTRDDIVGETSINLKLAKNEQLWVEPGFNGKLTGYRGDRGMYSWFGATLLTPIS